ncbi:MAG: glycoside hydrolase family 31 protein [Bacteroidia bacterium]|nr:glycoside hydrolase family 31 protein [Bacteroidia bacterium]
MQPNRFASAATNKRNTQLVEKWEIIDHIIFFYCADTTLAVTVCDQHTIRFRFAPEGRFDDDFSYAIATPAGAPVPIGEYVVEESGDDFIIRTTLLSCHISRTLHISLYNKAGLLISQDERGFGWQPHETYGGNVVYCSKKIQEQENFFGLGDKPERLNMRGLRFENWGSDTYGFERTSDPLYKNIPFFMGLHHNHAYGIFFDNSFRARFDFGHERGDILSFGAEGGEMNYYFIYGPELVTVAERYTQLTGRPHLPPLWSLGYHQSKWSYYPESVVTNLAARFRAEKIPCDAIHIDIDYMRGFRCFTWDDTRFPDPRRMTAELESDGFKSVVILDPGIKVDKHYEVYQQGIEKGYFCRRADGPVMQGKVWPGMCHFPDFTNPRVRAWWADLTAEFVRAGVHGVWNDMNEPVVLEQGTFPDDTRHDYDGHPCSHRKAHNIYGMQMARATWEGLNKGNFPRRPFGLSRTGYAGLQRYAATWTGDNLASWNHLWMANIQCQRLSVSGISFCGSDIGGFIGDTNGELYTRWMQMAVLHPFFRTHSSGDYGDQEPWSFGAPYTQAIRRAIELRYQLLPYIYTVFWRHTEYGTPMIQSLVFLDQEEPETFYRMEEFALGDQLLVCPIAAPGVLGRRMFLPQGKWYNYWTDAVATGREEFWADAPLDIMPLFVRAGAIIPHYPVMQYVGETEIEVLDMHLYYAEGSCSSQLYEDAGDYYDYQQGNIMLRTLTQTGSPHEVQIQQRRKGRFNAAYARLRFILHGFPFTPGIIEADGEKIRVRKPNGKESRYTFEVDKNFDEIVIRSFPPAEALSA